MSRHTEESDGTRTVAGDSASEKDAKRSQSTTSAGSKPWTPAATVLIVLAGVSWWTISIVLPDSTDSWHPGARGAVMIVGAILATAGVLLNRALRGSDEDGTFKRLPVLSDGVSAIMTIVGVVMIIAGSLGRFGVDLAGDSGEHRRFAIGVGGLAVGLLMIGLTRYDELRAAIGLPVIALLIGLVAYPEANKLIEDSLQKELVKWTSILLGATGGAEAVKQVVALGSGKRGDGDLSVPTD